MARPSRTIDQAAKEDKLAKIIRRHRRQRKLMSREEIREVLHRHRSAVAATAHRAGVASQRVSMWLAGENSQKVWEAADYVARKLLKLEAEEVA